MSQTYNVYCDESCHLENDHQTVMVLGAVWCPEESTRAVSDRLREIKERHKLPRDFEVKWSRVLSARLPFYVDYLDYFFDHDDLHFRCLVADKTRLNHQAFNQTHDEWYFKMYFEMLKALLKPQAHYRIFLDIKDTRSASKVAHLREVLCNNVYDFDRQVAAAGSAASPCSGGLQLRPDSGGSRRLRFTVDSLLHRAQSPTRPAAVGVDEG